MYLVRKIAPLHAQIGGDVLVDGPRKLIVELPRNESEDDGRDGHYNGESDEWATDLGPDREVIKTIQDLQRSDGFVDLIELDSGVDQDADVVDDQTDDLNGVLLGEGIVDQGDLVDVAEHEDGEVGGDGARLVVVVDIVLEGILEAGEDISRRTVSSGTETGEVEGKRRTLRGRGRRWPGSRR